MSSPGLRARLPNTWSNGRTYRERGNSHAVSSNINIKVRAGGALLIIITR